MSTTRSASSASRADRVGVAERAQVVDALEVGSRRRCSRRTLEPVASSALPKATSSLVESVAVFAATSSPATLVRVSSSIVCSSHHSLGRK